MPKFKQDYEVMHLDNGLSVYVLPDPNSPLISARTYVKAGSKLEEGYWGTGISHYLEHLVAGGTTSKRDEETYRVLISKLGGAFNAYTTTDHTSYYLNALPENVGLVINILYEWMFYCTMDTKEVKREQEVITREIEKTEASLSRAFYYLCQQNFYKNHPLRFPVIGYLQTFLGLKRKDLIAYYKEFYVPENMILVLGGPICMDDIKEVIGATFATEKRTARKVITSPVEDALITCRQLEREWTTSVTHYSLRFPTVSLFHKDLHALDLLDSILGQGQDSILHQLLVEKEKCAYSVQVASYTPADVHGYFDIHLECEYKDRPKIKKLVLNVLNDLAQEGVKKRYVNRGIKQKTAEDIFSITNIEDKVAKLGRAVIYGHSPTFFESYYDQFSKLGTTDLNRVLRTYFNENQLVESTLKPESKPAKISKGKNAKKLKQSKGKRLQLSNGIRVILYPEPSLPRVYVNYFLLGGLRAESKENNGISTLLAECIAKDCQATMDDHGASLGLNVGVNSLYFSLDCLTEDLEHLHSIMAKTFVTPNIKKEDVSEARRLLYKYIEQRADDWFSWSYYHFKKKFYPKHPYGFPINGEKKSIKNLSAKDLKQYFTQLKNPKEWVITVHGDFDEAMIIKEIKHHFSKVNAPKGGCSLMSPQPRTMHQKQSQSTKPIKQDLGVVLCGFDSVSHLDSDACLKIDLLRSVLSGVYYPVGRLHQQLREKGYVYTTHSLHRSGIDPGHLMVYALTSDAQVNDVKASIWKIITALKTELVSEEEFDLSIAQLKYYFKDKQSSLESLSMLHAIDEMYGHGFEHIHEMEDKIDSLTREDILNTAQQLLVNPQWMILK